LSFSGRSDAGVGLTSANRYYPISGIGEGSVTAQAQDLSMAVGGNVAALRVGLDGPVPGVGNSRTFTIFKNGIATSLAITYGAGEQGDKVVVATPGISFFGGDRLELVSTVSGTPANTNATWSTTVYQEETQ
jgi:hypothetical protein